MRKLIILLMAAIVVVLAARILLPQQNSTTTTGTQESIQAPIIPQPISTKIQTLKTVPVPSTSKPIVNPKTPSKPPAPAKAKQDDGCPAGSYRIDESRAGNIMCRIEPTGCPYGDSVPMKDCAKLQP